MRRSSSTTTGSRRSRRAATPTFPPTPRSSTAPGMTVLPGLIDCHDHMANHRYDLAHRWGIDEPHSTRHLRTAAVLRQTLEAGYTTIRDAGGLDAGFKRAIDEGLIAGPRLILSISIISPIGGIGDPVSPSGDCCCVPGDPLLPSGVVETPRRCAPGRAPDGARRRRRHQMRDDRRRQLAARPRAARRRLQPRRDAGPGRRGACARPPGDVPRARRPRSRHRDRGRRQFDRARLLSRRGPAPPRPDGGERGIFFVPTLLVYEYHRKSPQPHVKERAHRPPRAPRRWRSGGRSRPGSRSSPAPMPAGTATRPMPASSTAWSAPG